MWRWIMVLTLACFYFLPQHAKAEDQLDMSYSLPLGGLLKFDQWTRIDVKISNHADAVSGVLELGADEFDRNIFSSSYRQQISLQKDETKTFRFELPVEFLMRGSSVLRVVQEEKEIAVERLSSLRPRDERTVGVIDKHESAFHFLTLGSDKTAMFERVNPFIVQNIEPETLPEESWILKNLDILAIGDIEPGQISEKQLSAIKEWIRRGGVVILSPAASGSKPNDLINRFQDIIPVVQGPGGVRTDLRELREYTGETKLPFDRVPVYNQNLPFFTAKPFGAGIVLLANYNVSAEPLASWQYNRQLWQNVMSRHNVQGTLNLIERRGPVDMSLVSLSSYIPDVSTPSVNWIIAIWAIYLVVIAPILYFVLKRKERREWAWGIIPISAIILSVSVYGIGRPLVAKEDSSYVVSSIKILDEESAEIRSGASFLTLSGGNYGVKTDAGLLSIPLSAKQGNIALDGAVLRDDQKQSSVLQFENVPYLSIKQAYATGVRDDIGSFASALTVKDDRLQGKIKNNTRFELDELSINLGMQRIPLGPFKLGEEKQVDVKIEKYYVPTSYDEGYQQKLSREKRILQMKNEVTSNNYTNQIQLVGVCSENLHMFLLQRERKDHSWNVLRQTVELTPTADGHIVYPYGTMSIQIENTEGLFEPKAPNLYDLAKGSVTFALSVNRANLQLQRVQIPLDLSPYRPFKKEIFDVKKGQWTQLDREQSLDLQDDLKKYINRDGNILIRFSNASDQRFTFPQPFFQVEGKEVHQ